MDENGFTDELFKKKLAYPYEKFTLDNFQGPRSFAHSSSLNLTKEDFWSLLKQTTPPDEEINQTQETI